MVSKKVAGGLLVLAGVASVGIASMAFGNKTVDPIDRLKITGLLPEKQGGSSSGTHFQITEAIKLKVEGSELGSITAFMQTTSLQDGTVSDLQTKVINVNTAAKESEFAIVWQNFAIGQGALVEFFIWDINNNPASVPSMITLRG